LHSFNTIPRASHLSRGRLTLPLRLGVARGGSGKPSRPWPHA